MLVWIYIFRNATMLEITIMGFWSPSPMRAAKAQTGQYRHAISSRLSLPGTDPEFLERGFISSKVWGFA